MDAFTNGYGDVSRCVHSQTSLQSFPAACHLAATTTATNTCVTAQTLRERGASATMTCPARKSQTAPFNKMRGVHQALQRSQQAWFRQQHALPDQGKHLDERYRQHGMSVTSSSCGMLRRYSRHDEEEHRQGIRSVTSAPVLTCSKKTPSALSKPATTEHRRSQGHSEEMASGGAGGGHRDNGLTHQAEGAAEDFCICMRPAEKRRASLRAQRGARSDSRTEKGLWGSFTGSTTVAAEHSPDQEQGLGKQHGTLEWPTEQVRGKRAKLYHSHHRNCVPSMLWCEVPR